MSCVSPYFPWYEKGSIAKLLWPTVTSTWPPAVFGVRLCFGGGILFQVFGVDIPPAIVLFLFCRISFIV